MRWLEEAHKCEMAHTSGCAIGSPLTLTSKMLVAITETNLYCIASFFSVNMRSGNQYFTGPLDRFGEYQEVFLNRVWSMVLVDKRT